MKHLGRAISGSILAAVVAASAPATAKASDLPTNRLNEGAVVVLGHVPGIKASGAGTVIAENGTTIRVITANHVATFGNLTINFEDGTAVPAHVLVAYPQNDLAIIEATVDATHAAAIRPAVVGVPRSNEPVHIWGSGNAGPALESGAIAHVGDALPDGPANGRYPLNCDTCHRGDSGGGIFDAQGDLVGVYVGYFETDASRLSVAELLPARALSIARSTASPSQRTVGAANAAPTTMIAAAAS